MMETIERQLFIWRVLEKKNFGMIKLPNHGATNIGEMNHAGTAAAPPPAVPVPGRLPPVSRPCLARVSPRLSPRRFLTYLEPFPV